VRARSGEPAPRGGVGTTVLLAAILGFLGLLGGLPAFLGPAIGVLGAVGSYVLRRTDRGGTSVLALAPSLLALAILAPAAPAGPGTDLFAGLAALALLLWVADEPGRPSGTTRRAIPTIAPAALGVAFAWALSLGLPGQEADVGLAGSLIAGALVVLAFLLGNLSAPTGAAAPPARPGVAAAASRGVPAAPLKRRAASEPWDPR
jgi:hypothetical protein